MFSKLFRSCVVVITVTATFVGSLLVLLTGTAEGQVKVIDKVAAPPGMGKGQMKGKGGPANPDDPNTIGEFGSVTVVTEKKH